MKGLTPKVDNDQSDSGQLTAAEFNDMRNDAQNVVTESGQTLTASTGEDNRQLLKGVAIGGKRISRSNAETAEIGEIVLPENSGANLAITLPNTGLFVNATVDFEQVIDQPYSVWSLVIANNGNLIMGIAEDLTLDSANSDNSKLRFQWVGGTVGWSLSVIGIIGTTIVPT